MTFGGITLVVTRHWETGELTTIQVEERADELHLDAATGGSIIVTRSDTGERQEIPNDHIVLITDAE